MNKYNWDNSDQVFSPQTNDIISKSYQFKIPATGSVKPDVGNKDSANFIIDSLVVQKRSLRQQMAKIGAKLRASGTIDSKLLDEYQDLNEKLRFVTIYKAELVFLRNML